MIASPRAALQGRAGSGRQRGAPRGGGDTCGSPGAGRDRSGAPQEGGSRDGSAPERQNGAEGRPSGVGAAGAERVGAEGAKAAVGRPGAGRGGAHLGRNAVPPRRAQPARLRNRVRKAARRDEQRIAVRPIESERGAAVGRDEALLLLRLLLVGLGAEPTRHRKGSEAEPRPRNVTHGRAGRSRRQTKAKRGGTEPPTATGSARRADTGSRARAGREAAAAISDVGGTAAREAQAPPSARVTAGAAPAPSRCPPGRHRISAAIKLIFAEPRAAPGRVPPPPWGMEDGRCARPCLQVRAAERGSSR